MDIRFATTIAVVVVSLLISMTIIVLNVTYTLTA